MSSTTGWQRRMVLTAAQELIRKLPGVIGGQIRKDTRNLACPRFELQPAQAEDRRGLRQSRNHHRRQRAQVLRRAGFANTTAAWPLAAVTGPISAACRGRAGQAVGVGRGGQGRYGLMAP